MTGDVVLSSPPDLRRLYATAAFHRGNDRDSLPDEHLTLSGVSVDVGALAHYSRVCGFDLTGNLPITYPHLMGFPLQMKLMASSGFPLPLLGAVHIENVIHAHRPLSSGAPLDLRVWAKDVRPHRRGRQVDLVTEVSVEGEVAWQGVSTYLARGAHHPDVPSAQAPSFAGEAPALGPVWNLDAGTGRRYAKVSGDWNPIHLHALTARPLGFPTAIAHGMFTYAKVVAALAGRLPAAGLTSQVWFRKPVRLPSRVRLRSAIAPQRTLSRLESVSGEVEHAVVEQRW